MFNPRIIEAIKISPKPDDELALFLGIPEHIVRSVRGTYASPYHFIIDLSKCKQPHTTIRRIHAAMILENELSFEEAILKLRMNGYGIATVANMMGVEYNDVRDVCNDSGLVLKRTYVHEED